LLNLEESTSHNSRYIARLHCDPATDCWLPEHKIGMPEMVLRAPVIQTGALKGSGSSYPASIPTLAKAAVRVTPAFGVPSFAPYNPGGHMMRSRLFVRDAAWESQMSATRVYPANHHARARATKAESVNYGRVHRSDRITANKPAKLLDFRSLTLRI
jgi:hypothetical protein